MVFSTAAEFQDAKGFGAVELVCKLWANWNASSHPLNAAASHQPEMGLPKWEGCGKRLAPDDQGAKDTSQQRAFAPPERPVESLPKSRRSRGEFPDPRYSPMLESNSSSRSNCSGNAAAEPCSASSSASLDG